MTWYRYLCNVTVFWKIVFFLVYMYYTHPSDRISIGKNCVHYIRIFTVWQIKTSEKSYIYNYITECNNVKPSTYREGDNEVFMTSFAILMFNNAAAMLWAYIVRCKRDKITPVLSCLLTAVLGTTNITENMSYIID